MWEYYQWLLFYRALINDLVLILSGWRKGGEAKYNFCTIKETVVGSKFAKE